MHEIVTLQLGSQANYVGTHFWNLQESYFTYGSETPSPVDHDTHFRPGIGSDGQDTYTPRALIYDFKASFGTLRQVNELYELFGDEASGPVVWPGAPAPQRQPPVQQNEYQRRLHLGLDTPELTSADVRFWSDYNRVFYHPRSLVQIHDADLNPGSRAFETWQSGNELFSSLDREHDLYERDMRLFLEECDQIQGIQLLASGDTGWAAFASKYVERMRDEVDKLPILVWMLDKAPSPQQPVTINTSVIRARTAWETVPNSSVLVPLTTGFPQAHQLIDVDKSSSWSTAAFQLTGIESITLPTRTRASNSTSQFTFGDMESLLNGDSQRKIAELAFQLNHSNAANAVNGDFGGILTRDRKQCDFFPVDGTSGVTEFSQLEVGRGFSGDENAQLSNGSMQGYNEVQKEGLQFELPFKVLDSFPPLYGSRSERKQLPVRATLTTSSRVGAWLRHVERSAHRHVPLEDREEMSNGLVSIAEEYTASTLEEDDWDE